MESLILKFGSNVIFIGHVAQRHNESLRIAVLPEQLLGMDPHPPVRAGLCAIAGRDDAAVAFIVELLPSRTRIPDIGRMTQILGLRPNEFLGIPSESISYRLRDPLDEPSHVGLVDHVARVFGEQFESFFAYRSGFLRLHLGVDVLESTDPRHERAVGVVARRRHPRTEVTDGEIHSTVLFTSERMVKAEDSSATIRYWSCVIAARASAVSRRATSRSREPASATAIQPTTTSAMTQSHPFKSPK